MKKLSLTFLLLTVLTLPTLLPFFNSRFFYTQDYIFIARLHQMSAALSTGQFPVRWAPDLRYGEPLFNFYAPLPYYAGSIIHFLGFDFIWTAKILFILGSFLSAWAMYLLGKKLFGNKAGILAAVLYTYAPYRAVDMYVRGSLSETWAFIFFPLIFLTSVLLTESRTIKNVILLALSLAGLFLTHNVTTLMFLPVLALFWLYLIFKEKKWKFSLYFILSGFFAFCLSAFFLLPALFERNLIQTKYLIVGYFNFRAHFVAVKQFFSAFWGYGSSVWGPDDGLSFQIGLVNLAVLTLSGMFALYKREKKYLLLFSFLTVTFVLSVFLQHNKSAFIWEAIPQMAFIQFPWRFLGISIFIASLAGASLAPYLKNKFSILYIILIFAAFISTISYFKPKEYADDNFFNKFLDAETMQRGVDLTKDYLPVWVQTVDGDRFNVPGGEEGDIQIKNLSRTSASLQFWANSLSKNTVELPLAYFPGWEVMVDNKKITLKEPSKKGLIRFEIPEGDHFVIAQFKDTPVRKVGNIVSVVSIIILSGLLASGKLKRI